MRLDFPTIIVALVFVTGVIWAVDAAIFARRRRAAVARAEAAGEPVADRYLHEPKVVEYARSFFPVFFIVLVLRSFLIEPFRIPSNSMMPTLLTGDFIIVNKYAYGIRLPVVDVKVVDIGAPEHGDVVVFRYPEDPSTPFIKRIVGLPGDQIAYYNKVLYVNGEPADQRVVGTYVGVGSGADMTGARLVEERIGEADHKLLIQDGTPSAEGKMVVPDGHYFVLGDNRDNSRDSRYWGTVPDELLIGKAVRIWMNWDLGHGIDWSRIGDSIE